LIVSLSICVHLWLFFLLRVLRVSALHFVSQPCPMTFSPPAGTICDMPDVQDLPPVREILQAGIDAGLHVGAQIYASVHGRVIADFAIGEARPGVAMTTGSITLWLSATKPITAVCVAQLWERGQLRLDHPVAKFVPEFAAHGKDHVTIRHCLTHTAGLRLAANNFTKDPWDATIARICDTPIEPGWVVGKTAGYHTASTWFMLGEIIRRIDGRTFDQYVRDEVFLPLGMTDSWIGMPVEEYDIYGDRIAVMVNTDPQFKPRHNWDTPEMAAMSKPGGNGRGPVRQLGRFYEMLLNGGTLDGSRIISPQTVEAMTARQRVGLFDLSFKQVMDWGLGFVVNNAQYGAETVRYGFGPAASWRSYGHGGHQSSIGMADPKHGLAAAVVFNGTPGEAAHDRRVREVLGAVCDAAGI
jgi:CubicO group peptidase (beta-lactamase class C family)